MDRTHLFDLAAAEFGLTVQTQKSFEIDDDMFVTKLEISNVLARDSYDRKTIEFSGKPAHTKTLSIQNAYDAVLKYLEDERIIHVDDYNAVHVCELRHDVLRHSCWSMLFEDKVNKLQANIEEKDPSLRQALTALDSAMAPLQLLANQKPRARKRARRASFSTLGDTAMASVLSTLSESMTNLRDRLLSLTDDSLLTPRIKNIGQGTGGPSTAQ